MKQIHKQVAVTGIHHIHLSKFETRAFLAESQTCMYQHGGNEISSHVHSFHNEAEAAEGGAPL